MNAAVDMPTTDGPVVVINRFTPAEGQLEHFLEVQRAGLSLLAAQGTDLLGSRLYRGEDGATAVLVSVFGSESARRHFQASEAFARHRERLQPLLREAAPGAYREVYAFGTL